MNASTASSHDPHGHSLIAAYVKDLPRSLRALISCSVERCSAGHDRRHAGPCIPAVRCAGPLCEAKLPVPHVSQARLPGRLAAEGWLEWNGKWYCGRRCRDVDRARLSVAATSAEDRGRPTITRVSVDDVERGGETTRWIVCDLYECESRVKVRIDADGNAAARLAAAAGFVQYDFGTFCCHGHARKARAGILAGRQDPVLDPELPREHEDPPAVALAPDPLPPPPRTSLHAHPTVVAAQAAPQPAPEPKAPPAQAARAPEAARPPVASAPRPIPAPLPRRSRDR